MGNALILCPGNSMNCLHFEGNDRALCLGKQRKTAPAFLLLFTSVLSTHFGVCKQDMKVSVFPFAICPINR